MTDFVKKIIEFSRDREMKKWGYEKVLPPRNLNSIWFTYDGRGTETLTEKIELAERVARSNPEVENRVGNYFEIRDFLIVGGQARGGSDGDLDILIWTTGTKRPINPAHSDYKAVNVAMTRQLNGTNDIDQFISEKGKTELVDVYMSNSVPNHGGTGDNGRKGEAEQFYSSRFDCWVKIESKRDR